MDYSKIVEKALQPYSFKDPVIDFIRHNENITYKVFEKRTNDAYLLRVHKPITKNMEGVQNTRMAIQSELNFLMAWSDESELPVQTPFPSLKGELVTTVTFEQEEVPCSVLHWIDGETLSKEDMNEEEAVSTLGIHIARLHQFSQRYHPKSGFIRPAYGIEWTNAMISKLNTGMEMGIYSTKDYQILEQTLLMIVDRMSLWGVVANETWGFIHADINYSNLLRSSRGISFIDFGLSGNGYYSMDVAMGALLVKGELRDAFLSGYTKRMARKIEMEQLEAFMFLAIIGYYTFLISQPDKHRWIREHISGLIEQVCTPMLSNRRFFYHI